MRHRTRFPVLCIAITVTLAAAAQADVLTHKQTGETIRGKVADGMINGKNIVALEGGGSKFIVLAEWEVTEKTPTGEAAADASATKVETKEKTRVFVIPITGAIESKALVRGAIRALEEAKKKKANLIVFHLDTPGGRVDVADTMIELIERIDWAPTVAWVEGRVDRGAISAGAYITLATEKIYMAPGTTLGGAVPYRIESGSAEVDAKMQSIFRARFRALAEKRGHPVALADAMVDSSTSVVQVFVNDQQQLVSEGEARQLEKDHVKDAAFRRGKTVVTKGQVLTLTTNEAVEYGIARGQADTMEQLMARLGIEDYSVTEATWLTAWVSKTAKDEKTKFDRAVSVFDTSIDQAVESDPAERFYSEDRGSPAWKKQTQQCMGYLKNAAAALKEIERIAGDPQSDNYIEKEALDYMKSQLNGMYRRLGAEMK